MGGCASRKRGSEENPSSLTSRREGGEGSSEAQGRSPAVSMSFLKKYSFATVNPAFADFETSMHRTPEEEEATSKLRALAQESFGAAGSLIHDDDMYSSSDQKVSSIYIQEQQDGYTNGHEIEEVDSCSDQLAIQEIEEEEVEIPAQTIIINNNNNNHRITTKNRITPVEEKLVLSSSCMPNYSLGVIVNPEVRKRP